MQCQEHIANFNRHMCGNMYVCDERNLQLIYSIPPGLRVRKLRTGMVSNYLKITKQNFRHYYPDLLTLGGAIFFLLRDALLFLIDIRTISWIQGWIVHLSVACPCLTVHLSFSCYWD